MPYLASDVQVSVYSDKSPEVQAYSLNGYSLGKLLPTGVTLQYGLNIIPTAVLELSPRDADIVCDFEKYRRSTMRMDIMSKQGCTTFIGLVDGLSMSQSVGDMRMQLVLKHPFQLLAEINPKLLGYHSTGVPFTRRVEALQMELDRSEMRLVTLAIGEAIATDLSKPLPEGMISVLKAMVNSQLQWQLTQNAIGRSAQAAVMAAEAIREKHLKMATALLDSIDTSFVPTYLTLSDFHTLNFVLESICETRSNLLDVLLSLLETIGCGLVIGNSKAFVVPNSGFLRQHHKGTVRLGSTVTTPNVLHPSQYNSVSFNDNGYRDISGVYAMSDDRNVLGVDGIFLDPSGGTGGIVGEVMPYVISFNNAALRAAGVSEVSQTAANPDRPNSAAAAPETEGNSENAQREAMKKIVTKERESTDEGYRRSNLEEQRALDAMYRFANDWAQLRYYQLKFSDRTGAVNMLFNPNCAPGAVGQVYLRAPGVYIDFFVTGVTHEVRMHLPDVGQATTSLSFNCGRMGAYRSSPLTAGLEKLNLFDGFSALTSVKVAEAFVNDTR